jgi:hypothetical protein
MTSSAFVALADAQFRACQVLRDFIDGVVLSTVATNRDRSR